MITTRNGDPCLQTLFYAVALRDTGRIRAGERVQVGNIINHRWKLWQDESQTYDPADFRVDGSEPRKP